MAQSNGPSTPRAAVGSSSNMAKTKEQFRSEITVGVSQQAINLLIDNLAEAHVKIEELTAKLADLEKPASPTD